MTGVLWGFETAFRVDSGKNYLVLGREGLARDDILGFQVEMMASNKIPGVVPIRLRERNAELEIYYDLTGLVSLKNYLKRQHISKAEFVRLLDDMVSIMSDGCRYYLDSSSFVFSEEYIYLNPVSREVFLLYIPAAIQQDVGQSFQTMVVNTLIGSANIDTPDNFVQKLLKLFNNGEFNPGEFSRLLKSIDMGNCSSIDRQGGNVCPDRNAAAAGSAGDRRRGGASSTAGAEAGSGAGSGVGISCELQPLDTAVRGKVKNTRTTILAVLAVMAVTGAALSNIFDRWEGIGETLTGTQPAGYLPAAAAALLAAGAGVAWLVRSGNKRGKQQEEETLSQHAGLQRFVAEVNTSHVPGDLKVHQASNAHQASNVHQVLNVNTASNMHPGPDMHPASIIPVAADRPAVPDMPDTANMTEETVLLGPANFPFFMAVNGDETIVIDKPEFIIGRNESACDYAIRDRSIGRTHARIKTIDNVFYILDLDSKNGTSINNTRIMSSQQYELKHNDRVAFANVEYCFRVK